MKRENQEMLDELGKLEEQMNEERLESVKGQLILQTSQKKEDHQKAVTQLKKMITQNNTDRQTLRQQMEYAQREQMYFFEYQEFISQ